MLEIFREGAPISSDPAYFAIVASDFKDDPVRSTVRRLPSEIIVKLLETSKLRGYGIELVKRSTCSG